eukprot:5060005-Pleurochrysis_carterae.AAC.1
MADHAPLWLLPRVRDALEVAAANSVTFAQCALWARARKYTTLAHSGAMTPYVDELRRATCTHGGATHPE